MKNHLAKTLFNDMAVKGGREGGGGEVVPIMGSGMRDTGAAVKDIVQI